MTLFCVGDQKKRGKSHMYKQKDSRAWKDWKGKQSAQKASYTRWHIVMIYNY